MSMRVCRQGSLPWRHIVFIPHRTQDITSPEGKVQGPPGGMERGGLGRASGGKKPSNSEAGGKDGLVSTPVKSPLPGANSTK